MNAETTVSWEGAIEHLWEAEKRFTPQSVMRELVINRLRERYVNGERTVELYNEMMAVPLI